MVGPDAYFMGIIDFQQKWTITKRVRGVALACLVCIVYFTLKLAKIEDQHVNFDGYAFRY